MKSIYISCMKNFLLVLLIIIFHNNCQGQTVSWCTPGANWYYGFNWFAEYGYVHLSYQSDTLINGLPGQMIQAIKNTISQATWIYSSDTTTQYYFESGGIIFGLYNNNTSADTIYNFSLVPGDRYGFANAQCPDSEMWMITDTGHIVRNGISLRYQTVSASYFGNVFSDSIIERIGFINNYPFLFSLCISDIGYGPLCSYSDSNFSSYPDSVSVCIWLPNSIQEPDAANDINIYPNPAQSEITIESSNGKLFNQITVTDIFGREIHSEQTNSKLSIINCQLFPSGVCFIKVQLQDGSVVVKKFIKE